MLKSAVRMMGEDALCRAMVRSIRRPIPRTRWGFEPRCRAEDRARWLDALPDRFTLRDAAQTWGVSTKRASRRIATMSDKGLVRCTKRIGTGRIRSFFEKL